MKPFKCDLCDFSAGAKNHLQRHTNNVHERVRPFKCNLCDYSAAQKATLKKHIANHHKSVSIPNIPNPTMQSWSSYLSSHLPK